MDPETFNSMFGVIRAEGKRRAALRAQEEQSLDYSETGYAYHMWLFKDFPFVNEMCLMLLVALHHELDRGLVMLAARASHNGKEIDLGTLRKSVQRLNDSRKRNMKIEQLLSLKSCTHEKEMRALRLLANLYKHDGWKIPSKGLLTLLGLDPHKNYADLAESDWFLQGLAAFIGLKNAEDFCDVAEGFVKIAVEFLAEAQTKAKLSPIKRSPASMAPSTFVG